MSELSDSDLVIFDCDGVLVDSEKISAEMLIAELDSMGISVDMPYVARHFLGRSYPVVGRVAMDQFVIELPRPVPVGTDVEVLGEVSGIGDALMVQLRPLVRVG